MDSAPRPDSAPASDGEEQGRIYRRMITSVAVGVALAVLLHALWPAARAPVAWIAVACGTAVWGVVETADVRLSIGRAMLLFEAGLACFALAGALFLLRGDLVFLVAWGIGVYAFLRALQTAFRQRTADAQRRQAPAVAPR